MAASCFFHSITLKCLNYELSKKYYTQLFNCINQLEIKNLNNELVFFEKKEIESSVQFWGFFGLKLEDLKQTTVISKPENRNGVSSLSICFSSKSAIDELFNSMKKNGFLWSPKNFDYAPGYYSCCLSDPDGVAIELIYQD